MLSTSAPAGAHKLPTFLVVGAYKSGTTALYRYLSQHPQVYVSPLKETNFFALEGTTPSYQGPRDNQAPTNRLSITCWEDYQRQFEGVTDERAVGEASPLYLYSPDAPKRIQQRLPDVKLIAILRQPADRAYSNFLHLLRDDRERIHSFGTAWSQEDQRISANWAPIWHWQQIGYYAAQLQRYYDRFPRQQIRVFLHEDLIRRPEETFESLFDFIGVDPSFRPDTRHRPNQSGIPRNRWLHGVLRRLLINPLQASQRPALMDLGQSLRSQLLYKPAFDPQLRAKLTSMYRADIERLQTLLDRDLSHWLAS